MISAHSGDVNEYFPSIIFLSMTICFRCQNGGQPTNKVNIITPQAHLRRDKHWLVDPYYAHNAYIIRKSMDHSYGISCIYFCRLVTLRKYMLVRLTNDISFGK